MANPHLPEELLIVIFSRLPAKSIGKCRCLSKSWRIKLSASQFIDLHLSRKIHPESVILISPDHRLLTFKTSVDDSATIVSRKLGLTYQFDKVLGSCNGLVLLRNWRNRSMFLLNPITEQQVRIPNSTLSLASGSGMKVNSYGLGYDSSSKDYKIVRLVSYNSIDRGVVETLVDVYSVKNGFWRRGENSPGFLKRAKISADRLGVSLNSDGAFVNGAIHWLVYGLNGSVLVAVFDVSNELFRDNLIPTNIPTCNIPSHELYAVGGFLIIVEQGGKVDAWIMKEYGLAESWTKLKKIPAYGWSGYVKPLFFIGAEELVFRANSSVLIVCNLSTGITKDMIVDGVPASFLDGCAVVDGLDFPRQHGE